MVSSTTPRELARWPPFRATVRMIRLRSSSATRGNSSAGNAFRTPSFLESYLNLPVELSLPGVDEARSGRLPVNRRL